MAIVGCANCGGAMSVGSHTCGSCGFGTCGGCGSAMAPGLSTCGSCGWGMGAGSGFGFGPRREGLGDEIGAYMADKSALESLQDAGKGDSPMADMAAAGMRANQIKIGIGIAGMVVMVIIVLIVLGHAHSANQGLARLSRGWHVRMALRSVLPAHPWG